VNELHFSDNERLAEFEKIAIMNKMQYFRELEEDGNLYKGTRIIFNFYRLSF
jgi:hypothetical protein